MKRLILFFLLNTKALSGLASVFIVTSNSSIGPGTLYQAILDANSNGTAVRDSIRFSLPGHTVSDVTISLDRELPPLSSNIVLDGTSQPTSILGNASIKVRLIRSSLNYFNGLTIDNSSGIEIYGFYFSHFTSPANAPSDERKAAIFLKNASHVKIGSPNQQNGFGDNYTSVLSPTSPNLQEYIMVSSNVIGLDPTGSIAIPNAVAIDLSYLRNSTIGGTDQSYGNLISSNLNGISLGGLSGKIEVSFNVIGLDASGLKSFPQEQSIGIFANGETTNLTMSSNHIVSQGVGIKLDNLKQRYQLKENYIGTDLKDSDYGNSMYGIELYNCGAGEIGNGNVIAHNKEAIHVDFSYPVSILRNSIYCNQKSIVFDNMSKPVINAQISAIFSGGVSGTYLPNALVELFYDDECPDCQGKTWIASLSTDENGAWSYQGVLTGTITSTGTNQDGATSSFSTPTINSTGALIHHTSCGSPTGSITNLLVTDASYFLWQNSAGEIVGHDLDLINVPAGTYYLSTGQQGGCAVRSLDFVIQNTDIEYKVTSFTITAANCGEDNGSIRIDGFEHDVPSLLEWRDENGNVVGQGTQSSGLSAGRYTLFAQGAEGCINIAGQFTVPNESAPVIDLSNAMQNSSCDGGLVSLLGIKIIGSTAPYVSQWINQSGVKVADGLTLKAVPPGKYLLRVYDRNGCMQESELFDLTTLEHQPLSIPNSISPNGDGINDVWIIKGTENYPYADFCIYDRYGQRVFYSKGYHTFFDGRVNGRSLPDGVYYYIIDLKNDCPRLTGSLTIVK